MLISAGGARTGNSRHTTGVAAQGAWARVADPFVLLTMIGLAQCGEAEDLRLFACRTARRATQLAGVSGMVRPLIEQAEGRARARAPHALPSLAEAARELRAATARERPGHTPGAAERTRQAALTATLAVALDSPLEAAYASLTAAVWCVRSAAAAARRGAANNETEQLVRNFLLGAAADLRELVANPCAAEPEERVAALCARAGPVAAEVLAANPPAGGFRHAVASY